MPERAPLKEARADVVRVRVIDAVTSLLRAGQPLTFKDVAREAGVPERTVYRHFPTRTELLAAVFEWANHQIAQEGPRPTTAADAAEWVRQAFRGFDRLAPVIRQMLIEPDGRTLRLADAADRRRAAIELVENEVPGLDPLARDRVAAAIQVLSVAATWQSLHEYWDLDGPDAGETSVQAIELLLEGARARTRQPPTA
jgi:AcrR family transcriptional regulator